MAVKWFGSKILQEVDNAMERGLNMLANKIVKTAQDDMRKSKSGVRYPRAQTRSSAPYEAPAAQNAASGLSGRIHMKKTGKLSRKVGAKKPDEGEDYGLYLEVGTRHMVERPWLRPAVYEHTGSTCEEIFKRLM